MGSSLVGSSLNVLMIRVMGVVLFFVTTLYITNNFDPEGVGQYDFSRSLLIFLGAVALFGMQQSIIYFSGYLSARKRLGHLKKIYLKMVVLVFGLSALVFVIGRLMNLEYIVAITSFEISDTALKTITALFFYALTMLNIDAFRAVNKIYLSEIQRNILRYLLFFLAVIAINMMDQPEKLVDVFLWNFAILAVLSTFVLFFYFPKEGLTEEEEIFRSRDILRRSAPMAVSAVAFLLIQSLDILMLSSLSNYETVAYYGVAVKLTTLVSIVLTSVNAVIAPRIAEFFTARNREALNTTIQKATQLVFVITAPMILVLGIFGITILKIFGEGYEAANWALVILLAGQAVNTLCGSVGVYLNMTGKQKIFQVILLSALAINVALNFILIPEYGMNGAAIATAFSVILWNIAAVYYVYRKDRIRIFLNLKR